MGGSNLLTTWYLGLRGMTMKLRGTSRFPALLTWFECPTLTRSLGWNRTPWLCYCRFYNHIRTVAWYLDAIPYLSQAGLPFRVGPIPPLLWLDYLIIPPTLIIDRNRWYHRSNTSIRWLRRRSVRFLYGSAVLDFWGSFGYSSANGNWHVQSLDQKRISDGIAFYRLSMSSSMEYLEFFPSSVTYSTRYSSPIFVILLSLR